MGGHAIIEHGGIIQNIEDDHITVALEEIPSCAHCLAKTHCSLSADEHKQVTLSIPGHHFQPGQKVTVMLSRISGFKALLLGYILPFIIVLTALVVFLNITGKEQIAGIISVFAVIPYYLGLYLLRDKLKSNFEFTLKQ